MRAGERRRDLGLGRVARDGPRRPACPGTTRRRAAVTWRDQAIDLGADGGVGEGSRSRAPARRAATASVVVPATGRSLR